MSKYILVTGGAGYIGSHTAVELLNKGFEIVIVDNFCNSSVDTVKSIKQIANKQVVCYNADIRDKKALKNIFKDYDFFAVMHFAGLKAVSESCKMPLSYYENNVSGTISLLQVMCEFGVKKIVFSSSATVYGVPEKLPLDEQCKLWTTNPYGATKLVIEGILNDVCTSDSDFTAIILRYFNPVGAHKSGLIGENPVGIPNNLTPYIVQVASSKLPYLPVYGNDYNTVDGTGVRDYIHIEDLAMGHIKALEKVTDTGVSIFNLGTGKGYSVLEVLHAFEKACGKTLPFKILPRRSGDIDASFADPSKANKQLDWFTKYDIEDMADSLWNWVKVQNSNHQKS